MKKIVLIILSAALICGCDVLTSLSSGGVSGLSQSESNQAVRELLENSSVNALAKLGVTDGFFKNTEVKIPFPEGLEKVKTTLVNAGFSNQVNQFTEKMNRSAEDASACVKEIFINAIKQMTITDAMGILLGNQDAATEYFKRTTTTVLTSKVSGVVEKSNEKIKLASYWTPIMTQYNKLMQFTGGQQVNTDLTEYVTEKAVAGIFKMMAKEEKNIREKASAQSSDLLRRVFGGSSSSGTTGSTSTSGSSATKSGSSTSGTTIKTNSSSSGSSGTSGTTVKKKQ
ncbi:MAG: DUF4197 domain-containing protein [Bacteroidales bacterium]|nr:DUF4197 domain-containing protein [Bacteroidales bacterium]